MKLFKKITEFDRLKYLPPRFDAAFKDLAVFIVTNKDELLEKGSASSGSMYSAFVRTFYKKYPFIESST